VELSPPPYPSLATLHGVVTEDLAHLQRRLRCAGLSLGRSGIDAHRPPRRVLHTPRYDAMARSFARSGPHGTTMMCSTAALQVCLDAGQPHQTAARWAALHALGPVLMAAFATSARHAGRETGWASARMRAWLGMDPARTGPVGEAADPAAAWARYALRAPLLVLRDRSQPWDAPPGVTFADWVAGALPDPPTLDDLDYHLSTLFPPVRPRGYLEVRYLDAQPDGEWLAPVAVLAALLTDRDVVAEATDRAAPAAGRWRSAAHRGLADPVVASAARAVLDLACRHLTDTDLPAASRRTVVDIVRRRLAADRGGPT
jgi:glutamate--cysteine ligase